MKEKRETNTQSKCYHFFIKFKKKVNVIIHQEQCLFIKYQIRISIHLNFDKQNSI